MKTKLHRSEQLEPVGHFDFHRACWKKGELIAVCFTNMKTQTTKTFYTPAYNQQFDGYLKGMESLEMDKFIFHPVSKQAILIIYSETRTTAAKADLALEEFTATGVVTWRGSNSNDGLDSDSYTEPNKIH